MTTTTTTTEYRAVPSRPGFLAGSDGTIVGPSGRVRRAGLSNSGYLYFGRNVYAHALVCEAFHGPRPEGMEVAHHDGNRLNNQAGNLRWTTHRDNEADKIRHDQVARGDRSGRAKLTSEQVAQLRADRAAGDAMRTLAARYDISASHAARICRGLFWRHTL